MDKDLFVFVLLSVIGFCIGLATGKAVYDGANVHEGRITIGITYSCNKDYTSCACFKDEKVITCPIELKK